MAAMSAGPPPGGGGGGGGTMISHKPVFIRASLGVVDTGDADGMDDGFELWHFGNLDEMPTGDPDQDGLTNENEFTYSTDPSVSDTDEDGLLDGNEITAATNPLSMDHPAVNLTVYTRHAK
jgi:hypothetical protein